MMRPPTQLWDRRTYGFENLRSAMQKDFFDSIDPEPKSRFVATTYEKLEPPSRQA